jgi:formylglycine-generating enzyme required for sulfatase activity
MKLAYGILSIGIVLGFGGCKTSPEVSTAKEVVDHGVSAKIAGIGYPVVTPKYGLGLANHFGNNCVLLVRTEDPNFDEMQIFRTNCAGVSPGASPIATGLVEKFVLGSDLRKIYVKSAVNNKYYQTGSVICALGKVKAGGQDETENKFGDSIDCNLDIFNPEKKVTEIDVRLMMRDFCLSTNYKQGAPAEENQNCRIEKANDSVVSIDFNREGIYSRDTLPSPFLPTCAGDNSPMACAKFVKIPAGPFTMGTNVKIKNPGKYVPSGVPAGGTPVFEPDWRYDYVEFVKYIAPMRTYNLDYDYEIMDTPLTQGNVLSIVGAFNYWAIRGNYLPAKVDGFEIYFEGCTPDFSADSAKSTARTLKICTREPYLFRQEKKNPPSIDILLSFLNTLDQKYVYSIAMETEWEKAMHCGESSSFPSDWTAEAATCSPDNLNNRYAALPFIAQDRPNKCGIRGIFSNLIEVVKGKFEPDFLATHPDGAVNPMPKDMSGFTGKSLSSSFSQRNRDITPPCVVSSIWGRNEGKNGIAYKVRLVRRLR